jgi:hypothetical protein
VSAADAISVEACYERGWTDGLPVVPPTRAAVDAMLGEAEPSQVVAVLEPAGGVATLEKVAANAVMAGCLPEHLPVVVAAVRAAADPAFGLDRLLTTASSQAPMLLVGGPAAAAAGVDGGAEALGSTVRGNAAIGRALTLVLRNVGGLSPGGEPHATIGQAGARGLCFAENVELSPWPPCHEDWGGAPGRSCATVYAADAPLSIVDMGRTEPELVLRTIVESIAIPGTYNAFFREELWLVLSPQHAMTFADAGWSRADVAAAIHAGAAPAAASLRNRGLHGYVDGVLPERSLASLADDDPVALTASPDAVRVVVAGGPFGGYSAFLPGEGVSVTAEIRAA